EHRVDVSAAFHQEALHAPFVQVGEDRRDLERVPSVGHLGGWVVRRASFQAFAGDLHPTAPGVDDRACVPGVEQTCLRTDVSLPGDHGLEQVLGTSLVTTTLPSFLGTYEQTGVVRP